MLRPPLLLSHTVTCALLLGGSCASLSRQVGGRRYADVVEKPAAWILKNEEDLKRDQARPYFVHNNKSMSRCWSLRDGYMKLL